MKDDPIFRLVNESKLEISSAFTERTIEKLDRRLESRMKMKVYLIIIAVVVFMVLTTFLLISSGFKMVAFGTIINLPRILTMLIISLLSYFAILHLIMLSDSGFRPGKNITASGPV